MWERESARKWKREQERDGSFGILQGTGCYGNREGSHLQREALLQQLASVAKWCCCRVMLVGRGWKGIKCVHKYLKWKSGGEGDKRRQGETARGGWLGTCARVSSRLTWRRRTLISRAGGVREQSKVCHTRQEEALAHTPKQIYTCTHPHRHRNNAFYSLFSLPIYLIFDILVFFCLFFFPDCWHFLNIRRITQWRIPWPQIYLKPVIWYTKLNPVACKFSKCLESQILFSALN